MSYDSFHPKADRIYRVYMDTSKWFVDEANTSGSSLRGNMPYLLANWLKSNFPEIEDASAIATAGGSTRPDNFSFLYLDYSFSNIFDLNLPYEMFIQPRPLIAVIPELDNEETAKSVKEQFNWDIQYTLPQWSSNTNIPFNMAIPIGFRYNEEWLNDWRYYSFQMYILINQNVDILALQDKLDKVNIPEMSSNPISIVLTWLFS